MLTSKKCLLTLAVLLIGFLAAALVYRVHPPGGIVAIALTTTEAVKRYTPAGTEMSWDSIIVAIRSDGSISRSIRRFRRDGTIVMDTVEIQDQSTGRRTGIDNITRSTCTTLLPNSAAFGRVPALQPDERGDETGDLLGFHVFKTVEQHSLPDGALRIEKWIAPALNGYVLRRVDTVVHSDGRPGGFNLHEVLTVTLGAPDTQHFSVPSSYVERTPSEIARLTPEFLEGKLPLNSILERADRWYEQRKAVLPRNRD